MSRDEGDIMEQIQFLRTLIWLCRYVTVARDVRCDLVQERNKIFSCDNILTDNFRHEYIFLYPNHILHPLVFLGLT
jgi:hypothetical protein